MAFIPISKNTHSTEYTAYLRSPEWRSRREAIILAANGVCVRCGGIAKQVHHRTYDRIGQERDSDLEALCLPCHEKADQERTRETSRRRWHHRVDGYATKRYGENWEDAYAWDDVEEEFESWLESRGEY